MVNGPDCRVLVAMALSPPFPPQAADVKAITAAILTFLMDAIPIEKNIA